VENEGEFSVGDLHALSDFEQELDRTEGADRWNLRIAESTIAIDERIGTVVRRKPTGEVEWSTSLGDGLRSWFWPSLQTDGRLIYVKRQFEGVTALDASTGGVTWEATIPAECFWLSGDLLVLANGPQVVGLAAATGAEVFRLLLPAGKDFRPVAIVEAAGLFLVQTHAPPGGEGDAFLIDRAGRVQHRFSRQIISVLSSGPDLLVLTSADVRRIAPDNSVVWSTPFESPTWMASGTLIEAPDGDLIATLFCCIADRGVQVMRLSPVTGEARWRVWCAPLGVSHSEYSHTATVEWDGDRLRVISRGSSGAFVEWLKGGSGERVSRGQKNKW
jgi:hypothetical protein